MMNSADDLIIQGILNTFGVFQTYYESGALFTETSSNISWIGSIQSVPCSPIPIQTLPQLTSLSFFQISLRPLRRRLHRPHLRRRPPAPPAPHRQLRRRLRLHDAESLHRVLASLTSPRLRHRPRRRDAVCAVCGNLADLFQYEDWVGDWAGG
jgi:hypothetical protein